MGVKEDLRDTRPYWKVLVLSLIHIWRGTEIALFQFSCLSNM